MAYEPDRGRGAARDLSADRLVLGPVLEEPRERVRLAANLGEEEPPGRVTRRRSAFR